jgi:hypothetical protein
LAILLTAAAGCHSKPLGYPGFTHVASANGAEYYLDQETLAPTAVRHVFVVSQLIRNPNATHSIGNLAINCATRTTAASEYSVFDESGKFLASSNQLITDETSVVNFVCEREKSIPLIRGGFVESVVVNRLLSARESIWSPRVPDTIHLNIEKEQPLKAAVVLDKEFEDSGYKKRLLVIGSIPANGDYACHACNVLVSAFMLRHTESGWFLEAGNPYLAAAGSWGKAPDAALVSLGPQKIGFSFTSSDVAQGFESDDVEYFGAVGDTMYALIDIETHSAYGGTLFPAAESETSVRWEPQTTNGFYNLQLSTKGTKVDDSLMIVPSNKEATCKLSGTQYMCV